MCIIYAKIIVNKSLITEGVKNRLFLGLPTVQGFSTAQPCFSKKGLFFSLTYAVFVPEEIVPTQAATTFPARNYTMKISGAQP